MQTHYSYKIEKVIDPVTEKETFRDIATKTFYLVDTKSAYRRKLIERLVKQDEYLAKLPLKFDMIAKKHIDLKELTAFINGDLV